MNSSEEIIEVLLENEVLREQRILVHEVSFYLGNILTRITIKIYQALYRAEDPDQYESELSHYIKTPDLIQAHTPTSLCARTPALALSKAISSLTNSYNSAIEAGHSPNENWLHPRG